MNEILRNHSIFEISNNVFFYTSILIVVVLIFRSLKAHKIFILVAASLAVYALVWLTFFKDILTLEDVDFLLLLLGVSPIVLFLSFTNISTKIDIHYGNDGNRTHRDNSTYHHNDYDSTASERDNHIKHHSREDEKEREEHYYSDNNTSYSSDDFDFDDD